MCLPEYIEVDYFANMDMGITYQAPTIVKKIPAKPLATYNNMNHNNNLSSSSAMVTNEYGLPEVNPSAPSNRYNFDSLLGDDVLTVTIIIIIMTQMIV